jgi:acyl-CoA synthetase (AMP-forming)/AMP-acid ligase II
MAGVSEPLPGGPPRLVSLSDYVRRYATVTPDREALVFGAQRMTYAELDAAVDRCAAALSALGVAAEDRVAMLTTPRPEFIVVLLATLRLRAVWTGVNPKYRTEEIAHILADSRPRVFIALADSEGPAAVGALPIRLVTFPDALADLMANGSAPVASPLRALPDEPAVIVYTSGTTGRPKGAVLSHRCLIYAYEAVSLSFVGREEAREGLRLLCNLPPNHIGCLSEMVGNTLIRGGCLVLAERFEPAEALDLIEREQVTLFGGVPAMLQLMVQHPAFATADLSSVRAIGWGGAPAPIALVRTLAATGAHLFTNYGLTEGGAIVCATPPDNSLEDLADTVGRPAYIGEQRLVGDNGRPARLGQIGEIQLRGAGVFLGYWNDPDATEAAFTNDDWLKTGDLASARPDGRWVLHGRRGDMFKSGGYNVYPREIELELENHPDVALAAVVGTPHRLYFEVGHAFVQLRPGALVTEAKLLAYLRKRLANYKAPKRITVLDALPMLPIGKVDRAQLKAMARSAVTD